MKNLYLKAGTVAGMFLLAGSANAAVDAAAQTAIDGIPGDVTTVGTALVIAAATAVSFKWVKGTLFG